jgi:outer membrane receptor protein involved in Fe transport
MTTRTVFRASKVALGVSAALAANSGWAQTPDPSAQDDATEDVGVITVTGSRTITENVKSPTPITSVAIDEIALTTPSDTADALNKLPNIIGGRTPRSQDNASRNVSGNVLSLRNFGVSRTLVLLDGHRVAPSNQDGSVNIDTLPQMLMKQVDIVTGGASAIYGSDAVAGVVNFVLDKEFTGLTAKGDVGQSKYQDGDEYQLGIAWGTNLFSDRGHFQTSARIRKQDMIPIQNRPYGEDGQQWLLTGNGRLPDAANPNNSPYRNTPYSRVFNSGMYGNVQCGASCAFNNYTFNQAGILSPMIHGQPTGTSNIEIGGDGAYLKYGTFRSEVEMKDVFARFDLDLGESANWYVQGSWGQAENAADWTTWVVSAAANRPNTLFADNPFLTAATQLQLGSTIVCGTPAAAGRRCLPAAPATSPQTNSTPPPPPTTPFFSAPSYIFQRVGGQEANESPNRLYRTVGDQKSWNAETGITGQIGEEGGFSWEVFYSHSVSDLTVTNPNNTDNGKYLAALDAVSVNGTIQCWVSTQPQFAGLYPGCVPLNITDPAGPSVAAYEYLRTTTLWNLTQEMDNVGFAIGGGLWGLGLPAGEIRANFSADARWNTYTMESDHLPTDFVNCTGLRMCLANGGAPVRWVQNVNAPVDAKNHVYEGALEFNIPLLKEVPGFLDLSTNLSGRYTKYSTFDAVESWKVGLNWQIVDAIRLRGTLSSDIRAPNLNDLFQPAGVSSTGFVDPLTGGNNSLRLITRGNPDLTPEEARTLTVGMVFTPEFIPRFSLGIDYYRTEITDAITQISFQNTAVQNICMASAPTFDSPFCALAIRPITDPNDPNYRNVNFNFPTEILNSPLNAARQQTHGYDLQLDYSFEMFGGQFGVRHLASYQPENTTVNIPGAFPTWAVQPELLQSTFLSYRKGGWTAALQNRWLSGVNVANSDNRLNDLGNPNLATRGTQYYAEPRLPSFNVVDTTISKEFEISDGNMEAFLTVSNLLNERAPLYGSNSGLPGLFYPTLPFYDDMGRFYTAGFKVKF